MFQALKSNVPPRGWEKVSLSYTTKPALAKQKLTRRDRGPDVLAARVARLVQNHASNRGTQSEPVGTGRDSSGARRQEFQARYREELHAKKDALQLLKQKAKEGTITLVYAARGPQEDSPGPLIRVGSG